MLYISVLNKNKNMKITKALFLLLILNLSGSSVFAEETVPVTAPDVDLKPVIREECVYQPVEEPKYSASFVSVQSPFKVDPKVAFEVKAFVRNTGNTPWFSANSGCKGPQMSLGTDSPRDRVSHILPPNHRQENWEAVNRIKMDQIRVNPGEIASFTFKGVVNKSNDIVKEYYSPVLAGITWIDEAKFPVELISGDGHKDLVEVRKRLEYKVASGSAMDINLNGEKSILVDLSDQKAFLKLDDQVVKEFIISSGAAKTPTPVGEFTIKFKQDVRVGGKAPHYIMPNFQGFGGNGTWRGYGFHALPSLKYDNGYFWTEARNHIGIPVSHGCVRMLPEDAVFTYNFTEVGTKVIVQR